MRAAFGAEFPRHGAFEIATRKLPGRSLGIAEAGVAKAIDLIRNELLTTMGLCGVNTIAEIDDHVLAI